MGLYSFVTHKLDKQMRYAEVWQQCNA